MSRKRKGFEIEMPDEVITPEPRIRSLDARRRGPMASAIAENAEALQERKKAAEAIREENNELAHQYVAAKQSGHLVEDIPTDEIRTTLLVRDRLIGFDDELRGLVTSIRETGLSNPIRIVPHPTEDTFELVQGYRRLQAYRELAQTDPAGGWDEIPAIVMPGDPDIASLYRRMVDENVIRKDLSFADMAHAATVYAADPQTEATDLTEAVAALFASAPYSKRSYIRSFAYLMSRLEGVLNFPSEIPRALGVALARAMKDRPEIADLVKRDLADWGDNRSVTEELAILRHHAEVDEFDTPDPEVPPRAKPVKRAGGGRTKTTFHMKSAAGQVKCTASHGRLEIKVDRDFSAIDRERLERAVAALVNGL